MNAKTVKLLAKVAGTAHPSRRDRLYARLKGEWKASPWNKRAAMRKSLRHFLREHKQALRAESAR